MDNLKTAAARVYRLSHIYDDEKEIPVVANPIISQSFLVEGLYAAAVECVDIVRRVCNLNETRMKFAFPKVHDAVTTPPPFNDEKPLSVLAVDIQEAASEYETKWTHTSAESLLTACADWMKAAIYEADAVTDWTILQAIGGGNPVRGVCKSLESLLGFATYSGKTDV